MKVSEIKVDLLDHMGSDLSVVNAARVSFHKESKWEPDGKGVRTLSEADTRLINYLAKHKHYSPFNHTFITARIRAPIFVARQLVKHKFMPWNEVSRRYVDEEPEYFLPTTWRSRPENGIKQGSSEKDFTHLNTLGYIEDALELVHKAYLEAINKGMAPEQARMILPQNMHTEWIWSGTLGAYADMLKLRLDPHAQYESRLVAEKLKEQIEPLYPISLKALLENK